jgi:hypothetical protein
LYYKVNISSIAFASAGIVVRRPTTDVDKFRDDLKWDEMSAEEQQICGVLGWNRKAGKRLRPNLSPKRLMGIH